MDKGLEHLMHEWHPPDSQEISLEKLDELKNMLCAKLGIAANGTLRRFTPLTEQDKVYAKFYGIKSFEHKPTLEDFDRAYKYIQKMEAFAQQDSAADLAREKVCKLLNTLPHYVQQFGYLVLFQDVDKTAKKSQQHQAKMERLSTATTRLTKLKTAGKKWIKEQTK